ncbi:MAG: DNA polymerase III subunit epsilon, partial [Pseudomonadota bacterium]
LDTETTGLDPSAGHRIVEIGCLELANKVPTGREFHSYLDPERDMPTSAFEIHGLSAEFLSGQPTFKAVAEDFLRFIRTDKLIIHNAEFDLRFLNAEIARVEREPIDHGRAIDTLLIARQKFPGAQASLDALCKRFGVDTTARVKHGALVDCGLLAQVYVELTGGRQPGLALHASADQDIPLETARERSVRPPRPHAPAAEESAAHTAFLDKLDDPLWRK